MMPVVDGGHTQAGRTEFDAFVRAEGDRLLHAAFGLCGDWQHAEDLVQQALVAVASRWAGIRANPAGYAYRCLVRANIDRWRVLRRRPEILADPTTMSTATGRRSVQPTDGVEDRLTVSGALQALPPRQRAIVVLRYLQDLSESETARVLGISTGAVKSGASRGLAHLRAAGPSLFEEVDR